MTTMTREEHLKWCKTRAHEYLKAGDTGGAIASMVSDMNKHPETAIGSAMMAALTVVAMMGRDDPVATSRWIDGFN